MSRRTPWETDIFLRGRIEFLLEDEWADAESQREKAQDKVKTVCQGATPWKRGIFQREKLSSFSEGEWASTESQREMMQEKVKLVCQGTALWKKGIFLRWSIEFFTGGWVRWCWVPKRDDPENQKNDYKTEEKSRKGKYKHLF